MKKNTSLLLAGFFVFNLSCLTSEKAFAHSSKPVAEKKKAPISQKENSLYYFLSSELENLEGRGQTSLMYLDSAIRKNPDSSYLKTQKAYSLARNGKFDEAQKMAESVINQNPNDAELVLLLGKLATSRHESAKAIGYYQKSIALNAKSDEAYNLLAREYIQLKKPEQAVVALRRLIDQDADNEDARFYLASIYATQLKNLPAALVVYKDMLELAPGDPKVMTMIAEIYLAQKNYPEAVKILEKLKELMPTDAALRVRVGLLYYELHKVDEAIANFEEILKLHPNTDKIPYYLGLLQLEKKDFAKAAEYFAKIPESSGYYTESLTKRLASLKQVGRLDEALTVAKKALSRNQRTAEMYDLVASLYGIKKDYASALKVLKTGQKKMPGSDVIYFSMGVVYEKMGKWKEAVDSMKKVLTIDSGNVAALNFAGYTMAENGYNLDEAQTLVEKALKLKPTDGFIVDSLGWVFFMKNDLPKATQYLQKAYAMEPNEPTILEHMGDLAAKKKNTTQAKIYYQRAVEQLKKKTSRDARDEDQLKKLNSKLGL